MKTFTADDRIYNCTILSSFWKLEIHFLKVSIETVYIYYAYSPKIHTAAYLAAG